MIENSNYNAVHIDIAFQEFVHITLLKAVFLRIIIGYTVCNNTITCKKIHARK